MNRKPFCLKPNDTSVFTFFASSPLIRLPNWLESGVGHRGIWLRHHLSQPALHISVPILPRYSKLAKPFFRRAQNNSEVHLDDILPQGFAMLSTFYLWLFALVQINNCLDVWKGTTVNIATICKGNNRKVICGNLVENHWYLSKQVGRNLKRMLTSLLGHSEQAIINLHILTDEETKPWVDATVSNVVGRHITEGIVFGYEDNNVTLKTEFIGDKNLEAA